MTQTISANAAAVPRIISPMLYRAVWRWHFYAGLFVIPFLMMLALTGGFMMIYSGIGNELGWAPDVEIVSTTLPVSEQAKAALKAAPGGKLATYIAPEAANRPAYFEVGKDGATWSVAVDPYLGIVLSSQDEATTYRTIAEKIHGTLLIGTVGDRLIEAAASLSIILVATGLYLWWPRDRGILGAFVPRLRARGRALWKELHMVTGIWMSAFLIVFVVTGLAWAGIWGDTMVKPWSTFPAEKWDNVPLSDTTHAAMNHSGRHDVPWALENTPLPASGSMVGAQAVTLPVTIDAVAAWAGQNGFRRQYKLALPQNEKGVYTVSYDARNEDGALPSGDRFVHIDQYTGNILADIGYADYKIGGKLMAWGIALHKGMAGTWNFVFNLAYLALVIFLCVSGVVMWWKRRPQGRLAAPSYTTDFRLTSGVAAIAVVLGTAFPMGGLAIICFALVDFLLPLRWKAAGASA